MVTKLRHRQQYVAPWAYSRVTTQERNGRQGNRRPYRQRTTNRCGCPEDVFVVLRFSCPFFSPLVVLCFLVLLFCVACHISGGTRHLLVYSISFYLFLFFSSFLSPFRFLCERIWVASICMPYLSNLRNSIVYSAYYVRR